MADNKFPEQDKDLTGLKKESFEKYDDLESYDRLRYFLLVLLELTRIWRDLHSIDNYYKAIVLASIANQWSNMLDQIGYMRTLGHNIDALITISSSFRKYIKFQNTFNIKETELVEIMDERGENKYILELQEHETQTYTATSLLDLITELAGFADKGHLKSKCK